MSFLTGFSCLGGIMDSANDRSASVAIVKTTDRKTGIPRAAAMLEEASFSEKDVYLKCNYNSPDNFPATTHPDALRTAVKLLRAKECRNIILVERSGMGLTREVLKELGTTDLIRQLKVTFLPLEEVTADQWQRVYFPESHWKDGIEVPRFLNQEACVVQVCNLNTHRFGGQFSASLKNSIGLIAKYSLEDPQTNYMKELHDSPNQCQMIAEVNQAYSPQLLLMDAVQSFISGGPETGELADSGVIVASKDRVALDAVGLAVLRYYGAGFPLNRGSIFDQPQIKRAAELGLGVRSPKQIRLVADDDESRFFSAKLANLLNLSLSE
jgi:uncharacterized protein (DUF362 family)